MPNYTGLPNQQELLYLNSLVNPRQAAIPGSPVSYPWNMEPSPYTGPSQQDLTAINKLTNPKTPLKRLVYPWSTGSNATAKDYTAIKDDIRKMLDQGAPEEDIDLYLAYKGVTAEELPPSEMDRAAFG